MNRFLSSALRPWLLAVPAFAAGAALIALLPEATLFGPPPGHRSSDTAGGRLHTCPVRDHTGPHPGDCPVCGLPLQPVTAAEIARDLRLRHDLATATVITGPAIATIQASGTVRYDDREMQVVIPRVAGRVVRRHPAAWHEGTLVEAGAPVVDLYSPEVFAAQGELAAAVTLADAHTLHALIEKFLRWNLVAVAQGILAGGAPVDTVTITSPFAGLVVLDAGPGAGARARLPQVGEEVMPDTPLVRLVDPQAFMVVLQVPESRAHWLREGMAANLASDDRGPLPDLPTTVSWVAPELDPVLRTREVHLHLRDPQGRLLPGSLVHARLPAALDSDLRPVNPADSAAAAFTLVPSPAILATGIRHLAWRVASRDREGRPQLEAVPLTLGPRLTDAAGRDLTIVRTGLRPGDEVAARAAFVLDAQIQLAGTAPIAARRDER